MINNGKNDDHKLGVDAIGNINNLGNTTQQYNKNFVR